MKLFVVSHWEPFPSSEYGGMQVIFAESADACVRIIMDSEDVKRWLADASNQRSPYHGVKELSTLGALATEVARCVAEAEVFDLDEAKPGILSEFRT